MLKLVLLIYSSWHIELQAYFNDKTVSKWNKQTRDAICIVECHKQLCDNCIVCLHMLLLFTRHHDW